MIRVLVIDNQHLMRDHIDGMLNSTDIEIAGEARDGYGAVEFILKEDADIVLIDTETPGLDSMRVAEQLQFIDDKVRVLFLSSFYDRDVLEQALECGAHGYLLKSAGGRELTKAIHTAYDGSKYYSPEIFGLFSERLNERLVA